MTPEQRDQVSELFEAALERDSNQRDAFLNEACHDAEIRVEVMSLLAEHERAGTFMQKPVLGSIPPWEAKAPAIGKEAERELMAGQMLNERYAIEKELKRGGFGIIYLARDQKVHSRPVVVKVLLEDAFRNEWIVKKFLQEVEALSRVDHPGIVGIIDAGELADGKPYIVMQYIDGVVLRSIMPMEGMDLNRASEVLRQVGRALTAAHDKGILHRDLKPENIMLQTLGHGEEQVKIIDFGIARIKDSLIAPNSSTTSQSAGTVAYMAPEQLSSRPISSATDVYSLGMIAYEMVTGRKPFNPATAFELLDLQRAGARLRPGDLRPGLPKRAGEVILQALSFDPSDRPQRARDFTEELGRALKNETGSLLAGQQPLVEIPPVTELSSETRLPQRSEEKQPPQETIRSLLDPTPSSSSSSNADKVGSFALPDYLRSKTPALQRRHSPLLVALIVGLLLLAIAGTSTWYVTSSRQSPENRQVAAATVPERSLNYSLTVQKMRDNKAYQEPFESSGQEIFENGWKFRMNLTSPQSGFVYLLNEGPAAGGASTYNMLFPEPNTNGGSPGVGANQRLETAWMRFDEHQGTEKFWIVWAASTVKELDAVAGTVNPRQKGEISDSVQAKAVRDFLEKHSSPMPEIAKDPGGVRTTISGRGAVLVSNIEMRHR